MPRSPLRRGLIVAPIGGFLCAIAVLVGNELGIPGFSGRTGFWGTNSLNSMLYSMGSDTAAIMTVCAVWFVYGTFIAFIITITLFAIVEEP